MKNEFRQQPETPETNGTKIGDIVKFIRDVARKLIEAKGAITIPPKLQNMLRTGTLATLGLINSAEAQVLTTATPLGNGNESVIATTNVIKTPAGNSNYSFGGYTRGLTDKTDLYLGAGITTLRDATGEHKSQGGVYAGVNRNLINTKNFDVSLFNSLNTALSEREKAHTATLFTAVIGNAPIKPLNLDVYGSFNSLIPLGPDTQKQLFTPHNPQHAITFGAFKPLGKTYGVYGEFSQGVKGNSAKIFSFGIVHSLSKR